MLVKGTKFFVSLSVATVLVAGCSTGGPAQPETAAPADPAKERVTAAVESYYGALNRRSRDGLKTYTCANTASAWGLPDLDFDGSYNVVEVTNVLSVNNIALARVKSELVNGAKSTSKTEVWTLSLEGPTWTKCQTKFSTFGVAGDHESEEGQRVLTAYTDFLHGFAGGGGENPDLICEQDRRYIGKGTANPQTVSDVTYQVLNNDGPNAVVTATYTIATDNPTIKRSPVTFTREGILAKENGKWVECGQLYDWQDWTTG